MYDVASWPWSILDRSLDPDQQKIPHSIACGVLSKASI